MGPAVTISLKERQGKLGKKILAEDCEGDGVRQ
jgi:hypothetical protein